MSSTYGKNITLSLFGDGASSAVGAVIEGLPVGFAPDAGKLRSIAEYKVLSGMHADKCSGTPLCVLFPAPDKVQLAETVSRDLMRPSMGDLGEYKRAEGKMVQRNGHHTADLARTALLFAGELAAQLLSKKHIHVYSHILQLGEVTDQRLEDSPRLEDCLPALQKGDLPVLDKRKEMLMKVAIAKAQADGDTLGHRIESLVTGLPVGLGAPVFSGIKTQIAALLFSLPLTKSVEFGDGVAAAASTGSQFNDLPFMDTTCGKIVTKTNHHGGEEGNMSNGMPLCVTVSFAPSPIIGKPQPTVHRSEQRAATLPPFLAPAPTTAKEDCALVRAALLLSTIDMITDEL